MSAPAENWIEELRSIDAALAEAAEAQARELESARRALDDAKRLASSVIQNISHEVRTPVTVIRGLLDVLAEDLGSTLSDAQRDLVERVRHSSQQILEVIQGLLDLAKAGAGMVAARRDRTYFPDLVADLVRGVEHELGKKGVRLTVDAPRGIEWLNVDGALLRQLVGHLLSNAVKFTARGEVRLIARLVGARPSTTFPAPGLRTPAPEGDTLEIRVEDTGEGIPPEEQERIFEAFRQVDSSRARKYEGLGIGLTAARETSNVLGASIELASRAGEGTRIRLLVPLTEAPPEPKDRPATPPPARVPASEPIASRGVAADLASLVSLSPASEEEAVSFAIDFLDRLVRPEVSLFARPSAEGTERIVDLVGHGAHGLAPGGRCPLSHEALARLAASPRPLTEEGDAAWTAIAVSRGGTRAGTLAVRRRNTESDGGEADDVVRIAAAWLGRELERLHAARERTEIVATIGRDLKNPLGSLLAHTQSLLRGLAAPLAPAQRPAILELERTIHRVILSALDLLDHQRICARGPEVERRPFSVEAVIAHVLARQAAAIELGGANVERSVSADLSPALGDLIRTDRALSIVVRFLLERLPSGASLAFTASAEPDAIVVEVASQAKDVAALAEVLGPGPAPVEIGATLGLRLARAWIEAQGGRLSAALHSGDVVVRFELPRHAASG